MRLLFDMIQLLVILIFLIAILATIIASWWLSRKYQERYAEFPWWKTGLILAIEILSLIAFIIFWSWLKSQFWIVAIIVIIIIIILLKRKKRTG